MKYDIWNIAGYDRKTAAGLFREGLNPLVALLLTARGITSDEEIKLLTHADPADLQDPFLLKDMSAAADRIRTAIESGEHIAIYGDYDVDGITSSCLLATYFRDKGLNCEIFIPERLEDGYGVKCSAVDRLKAQGVSLIVTVDCGITAVEEASHAAALGIDMVITDHHECAKTLPNAVAVVDPKRPDCSGGGGFLAGVGVAFKLICALEGTENIRYLFEKYGDFVAVGTIADVMPVLGENRIFIRSGLETLRRGKRAGFKALCRAAGIDYHAVSVTNVGFGIAPRLNAAGRLGSTDTAAELLLTADRDKAEKLAENLCCLNKERQQIEGVMFQQALDRLGSTADNNVPIVLADSAWHQGVAGIVASRLSEKMSLPAIMICLQDGVGRGSCRSFGKFNIYDALDHCRDLLLGFGGHEMAAGLTIKEENVDVFRERLGEYYGKTQGKSAKSVLSIDAEIIKPEILTVENVDALKTLEPYGNGNPTPLFCIKNALVQTVVPISGGKHTKYWINKDGDTLECVFFSKTAKELGAIAGSTVDIAFEPRINEFKGRRSVQLFLTDLYLHNSRREGEV